MREADRLSKEINNGHIFLSTEQLQQQQLTLSLDAARDKLDGGTVRQLLDDTGNTFYIGITSQRIEQEAFQWSTRAKISTSGDRYVPCITHTDGRRINTTTEAQQYFGFRAFLWTDTAM
jgi:hypothetical protein